MRKVQERQTFGKALTKALPCLTFLFALCCVIMRDHTLLSLDSNLPAMSSVNLIGLGGSMTAYFFLAAYKSLKRR